jgi:hypothetical protein
MHGFMLGICLWVLLGSSSWSNEFLDHYRLKANGYSHQADVCNASRSNECMNRQNSCRANCPKKIDPDN